MANNAVHKTQPVSRSRRKRPARNQEGSREYLRNQPARYDLFESERQLLLKPDWQGLVDAGVSIYLLTKLGATLNVDLLEVGASMRGMPREEFLRLIKEQGERNRKYAVLLE